MKAVVLCAGKGTRIRDITEDKIPKPMIKLDGAPILEYTLSSLEEQGVDEALINLHHKGEAIKEYFDSSYQSMNIKYFWEERLRGTSGSLGQMKNDLNDDFLVVYGDIVTDLDYNDLKSSHLSSGCIGTILTYSGEETLSEASVIQMRNNRIEEFIEKPSEQKVRSLESEGKTWTNASVYCLSPEVLNFVPETGSQDFGNDLFPRILEGERELNGYRLPKNAYWREIGRPEDYRELMQDISKGKIEWV
jgi:mannose-1-phosphate guanylyltransferase/phosphomannomutase